MLPGKLYNLVKDLLWVMTMPTPTILSALEDSQPEAASPPSAPLPSIELAADDHSGAPCGRLQEISLR
jgi:hypothetical protein